MKEIENPLSYRVMETMRSMYFLEDVLRSLQGACINLYNESTKLSLLNEDHAQECIHSSSNFLDNLASMELHLTLLNNFYQCEYKDYQDKIISELVIKYHIK